MECTIRKVKEIQEIGVQLVDMDEAERNAFRKKRRGIHGFEKENPIEPETRAMKDARRRRGKAMIGGKEEVESEELERRGRDPAPKKSKSNKVGGVHMDDWQKAADKHNYNDNPWLPDPRDASKGSVRAALRTAKDPEDRLRWSQRNRQRQQCVVHSTRRSTS